MRQVVLGIGRGHWQTGFIREVMLGIDAAADEGVVSPIAERREAGMRHYRMRTAMSVGNEVNIDSLRMRTRTMAGPGLASLGTRTGPWKRAAQQRSFSSYLTVTDFPPGSLLGNSISTTG